MIRLFQKGGMLSECYERVSISADDWFTKGRPFVIMSVIMHVKSLAICRKSKASCPGSRLLSVHVRPAGAER